MSFNVPVFLLASLPTTKASGTRACLPSFVSMKMVNCLWMPAAVKASKSGMSLQGFQEQSCARNIGWPWQLADMMLQSSERSSLARASTIPYGLAIVLGPAQDFFFGGEWLRTA